MLANTARFLQNIRELKKMQRQRQKKSILKCTFPSSQTFHDFSNIFHAVQQPGLK